MRVFDRRAGADDPKDDIHNALERETRELRETNNIPSKAIASFAWAELDPWLKS